MNGNLWNNSNYFVLVFRKFISSKELLKCLKDSRYEFFKRKNLKVIKKWFRWQALYRVISDASLKSHTKIKF